MRSVNKPRQIDFSRVAGLGVSAILLLFVGGALGGALGAGGEVGTLSVLRGSLPEWAKVLLALVIPPLSIAVFLVIATLFALKFSH